LRTLEPFEPHAGPVLVQGDQGDPVKAEFLHARVQGIAVQVGVLAFFRRALGISHPEATPGAQALGRGLAVLFRRGQVGGERDDETRLARSAGLHRGVQDMEQTDGF